MIRTALITVGGPLLVAVLAWVAMFLFFPHTDVETAFGVIAYAALTGLIGSGAFIWWSRRQP